MSENEDLRMTSWKYVIRSGHPHHGASKHLRAHYWKYILTDFVKHAKLFNQLFDFLLACTMKSPPTSLHVANK